MPSLPQNRLAQTAFPGPRGYSVSLLQTAAALYGSDVARRLGEQDGLMHAQSLGRDGTIAFIEDEDLCHHTYRHMAK
ncbi:hypothetical protein [Sphingobium estronivorans]|uniref:hypothetical protein n=1 Tax=Sphingobium estronivorans TaxID=1577690 RepID=UPI0013C3128C|nr:hypothetical protein [Sphingobium estronivorans]